MESQNFVVTSLTRKNSEAWSGGCILVSAFSLSRYNQWIVTYAWLLLTQPLNCSLGIFMWFWYANVLICLLLVTDESCTDFEFSCCLLGVGPMWYCPTRRWMPKGQWLRIPIGLQHVERWSHALSTSWLFQVWSIMKISLMWEARFKNAKFSWKCWLLLLWCLPGIHIFPPCIRIVLF